MPTGKDPVGVGGGGVLVDPVLLPPPQPVIAETANKVAITTTRATLGFRPKPSKTQPAIHPPNDVNNGSESLGRAWAAVAAVVVMVSVVLPLPSMVAGEKLQLAPAGNPWHAA